jgi:hypothetical protein
MNSTPTRSRSTLQMSSSSLADCSLIRSVFESYAYVADLVEDNNTTICRLRKQFFGAGTGSIRSGNSPARHLSWVPTRE